MNWYQKWRSLTYSYQYLLPNSFIYLLIFLFELSVQCAVASTLQWWLLNTFYQLIALAALQQCLMSDTEKLCLRWKKFKPFDTVNGVVCNLCEIIECKQERKIIIVFFVAITCIRVKRNEWTKDHRPHSRRRIPFYSNPRQFMFEKIFCFCFTIFMDHRECEN